MMYGYLTSPSLYHVNYVMGIISWIWNGILNFYDVLFSFYDIAYSHLGTVTSKTWNRKVKLFANSKASLQKEKLFK